MANTPDISPELLRQLLDYNPDTGVLTWRWRDPAIFPGRGTLVFNGRNAGKVAGSAHWTGYVRVSLLRRWYLAHRLIWEMVHGEAPKGDIDHIDGDPANNALHNLRVVSKSENMRNMRLHDRNQTGAHGVQFRRGRWHAQISLNHKAHYLGCFDNFEDAVAARRESEVANGFSANHGRAR